MVTGFINWNIDPEIIKLFGVFSLRYYGLLFVTGLLLGYFIVKRIYVKENLPIESLEKLAVFIFIGTIVGARFGHCLFYVDKTVEVVPPISVQVVPGISVEVVPLYSSI